MKPTSIHKAALYFKETDPHTPITESAIRRLVASGEIRSCKVGTKNIVTIEAIEEYFSGKSAEARSAPAVMPAIRPLSNRV